MERIAGAMLGAGIGVAAGMALSLGLVAADAWTPYSHEYATGIKFAGAYEAGCGVELPTDLGRDAGLTLFYCEQGDGGTGWVEGWFTTTYEDDGWMDTYGAE